MPRGQPRFEDDLQDDCIICLERKREPKRLGCGHSFCTSCLKAHEKMSMQWMAMCPLCRHKYLNWAFVLSLPNIIVVMAVIGFFLVLPLL